MELLKVIRERLPTVQWSEQPTQTRLIISRLSKQFVPGIDHYPGQLPFYHFAVQCGADIYEYISHIPNATGRLPIETNVVITSDDSRSIDGFIYLNDELQAVIKERYAQVCQQGAAAHPDLKPFYDLVECNCEHVATYLIAGIPVCSQVDHVDVLVGPTVITDLISMCDNLISNYINTATLTGRLESIVAQKLIKYLGTKYLTVLDRDHVIMFRLGLKAVISSGQFPPTIYQALIPIFGML